MSGAEEPEDEGPPSPSEDPQSVEACIDQRILKLQNRRFFLQEMQKRTKSKEDTQHDNEGKSELDLVEQEIEDLLLQKQILCNKGLGTPTGEVGISPISGKVKTTEGAIYTLPPPPPEEPPPPPEEPPAPPEEPPAPPEEPPAPPEEPPAPPEPSSPQEIKEQQQEEFKQIEPADCLGKVGAFTLCPSCEQVVFTQTKMFYGESAWLTSCIMGFVGLCFIAFFIDQLKSVRHKCPQCQSTIHTYHPF